MGERKWTPAQKNAIEADCGTVLVSAAAGSGKTSVLTERIIRKLIRQENAVKPDSLLVVTFTNAAAAEMRSRIYSGISSVMSEYPERRKEFISLLAVLGEMQVCTMDSFCINLVKENCHILGIESDFSILEHGESTLLKKRAVKTVLERRFSENSESFAALSKMFEAGKNDYRLIETVIKLSDFSMSAPEPDVWLRHLHEMFENKKACDSSWGLYLQKEMLSDIDYCIKLSDAALNELDTDEELAKQYLEHFEKDNELLRKSRVELEMAGWDEKISLAASLQKMLKRRIPNAPKGYGDNPVKISVCEKRDAINEVVKKITSYMSISETENASDMLHLRTVAKELTDTVTEYNGELLSYKKEMSSYDFSDISHFALQLLYDSAAADKKTALARELTEKYSEILIDEYQDTNAAQDALFASVSRNGKNMFFVGDVKQSIYRFRLASPEIFIEKCNSFPYYDGKSEKSKIILGHNFRSRKGILDGVNFIFSRLMSDECGDIDYNDDEKLNFPEGIEAEETTDVELSVLESGDEKEEVIEAEYIARKIRESLDNNVTVSVDGTERKAEPSDFCILLRSPAKIAVAYIKALERLSIPVSSDVSLNFFETPEIKTMMTFLRVLDNPVRDTDMLSVMLSPIFGFTADEVAEIRLKSGRRCSLFASVSMAAAKGDEKCKRFIEKMELYRKKAACASAGAVIRAIYDDSSYIFIAGAMKDGENRKKNLRKLLHKAEQMNENSSGLGSFVRYMDVLRENGADIAGSAGGNGVRIMSMHKSKGLEFPFVFIAGTTTQFNKSDLNSNLVINHREGLGLKIREPEKLKNYESLSSLAVKKINSNEQLSEELRVYYVALTRAKQKLHIVTALSGREKKIAGIRNLIGDMPVVPSYFVKHSLDASKWLIAALMLHPDAGKLRDPDSKTEKRNVKLKINLPEIEGVIIAADTETETAEVVPETVESIKERVAFVYKWADVASCRSKHTASSISEECFDPTGFGKSVPAFMFTGALSPVEIGTATHRFLQFCDFDSCRESVENECRRLVSVGKLTEKQASGVDTGAIKSFVDSDILERAEKSKALYREKQFTMAKSICELDSSISSEFCEEKTVIIGKIDLLFIEDDGAVIVDYKTDNISDIGVLEGRYISQMRLYAEALKKSMGVTVKECILYSLRLKDSISLKF